MGSFFSNNLYRFAVPGALALAVGGLTWCTQYALDLNTKAEPTSPQPETVVGEVLRFTARDAATGIICPVWLWDEDGPDGTPRRDSAYVLEYERGGQGDCYFTFLGSAIR